MDGVMDLVKLLHVGLKMCYVICGQPFIILIYSQSGYIIYKQPLICSQSVT